MSQLLDHLRGRVELLRFSHSAIILAEFGDGIDRWVLASLLQKAIRRGQSELALGAALKLLEIDPSRLWRRLITVALEDIGVGDLDVALDLAAVSCMPMARKALGGNRPSLELIVLSACRAVKDRTADHLASLVRWQGICAGRGKEHEALVMRPIQHRQQFLEAPPEMALVEGYGVGSCHLAQMPPVQPQYGVSQSAWQDQVYAVSALAGAWERGKLGLQEVLDHFGRQGAPLALLEACSCYARRCGDPLFVYALTSWVTWHKQGPDPLALARPPFGNRDLGGLPDYALDPLRTRLGRRAVELWLRSYLEKLPYDTRQVMAGLWNAESALCNQTLFWEAGGQIQRAAYQADLLVHGLNPERHTVLSGWIAQESSVLFAARQMVWQSHVRAWQGTQERQAGGLSSRWGADEGDRDPDCDPEGGRHGRKAEIGASGMGNNDAGTEGRTDGWPGRHPGGNHGAAGINVGTDGGPARVTAAIVAIQADGSAHQLHCPNPSDQELCDAQS